MKIKLNLTLILAIAVILLLGSNLLYCSRNKKNRIDATRWKTNYEQANEEARWYRSKSGNYVSIANRQQFTIRELRRANEDLGDNLAKAKNIAEDLKLKNKEIQRMLFVRLNAQNEITADIDTTNFSVGEDEVSPDEDQIITNDRPVLVRLDDGYLDMDLFMFWPDSLRADYEYEDGIDIVLPLIRKPNRNGEQVFFLWRWLRPWVPGDARIMTENPNSTIRADDIEIKRSFK